MINPTGTSDFMVESGFVARFFRDGILVVDDFLDAATIGEAIGAIEALEMDRQSSRVRRGVSFARRNLLELDFVRELIERAGVRGILDAIRPGLHAVRGILFDKSGSANWTVPWHQDRSIAVREKICVPGFGPWSVKAGVVHVQPPVEILREMVTLRFHLDSCGEENGPLRVVGGTQDRILRPEEIEIRVRTAGERACTCGAGGLVVMRPLILHASSPARRPTHRRVVHVEFGPRELPGGLEWARYG